MFGSSRRNPNSCESLKTSHSNDTYRLGFDNRLGMDDRSFSIVDPSCELIFAHNRRHVSFVQVFSDPKMTTFVPSKYRQQYQLADTRSRRLSSPDNRQDLERSRLSDGARFGELHAFMRVT